MYFRWDIDENIFGDKAIDLMKQFYTYCGHFFSPGIYGENLRLLHFNGFDKMINYHSSCTSFKLQFNF